MRSVMLAALAGLVLAGGARAADKDEIAAWWRGYEVGPIARTADGRGLRYFCQGTGGPVVVLESGWGAGAWAWRAIQPDMAKTTRVCSYDRAGYGRSDEAKDARDIDMLAADLAAVVKTVGHGRPVVVVGHSMGGPIVRQFAYRHPKLVAGMVLVDPSADHQPARFGAITPRYKAVDAASREPNRKCLAALEKGPIAMGAPEYGSCVGPAPPDMPADLRHFHVDYGQSPVHHRAALAELDGAWSEASGREADAAQTSLGAVPMIVLTAGKENLPPGFTREETAQFNALWRRMHWEMLAISTDGRRRFVEGAGHNIWLEKPEAVIQAVDEVVAEARVRPGARR
jgi:pimeloyl-ACP methyl ester carboxylesterase